MCGARLARPRELAGSKDSREGGDDGSSSMEGLRGRPHSAQ